MNLVLKDIEGGYSLGHDILQGVNLEVNTADAVGVIGLNGTGKTSLGKAIMNMLPYRKGKVLLDGVDVTMKSTQQLAKLGVTMFVQGGGVFDALSVWENLSLMSQDKEQIYEMLDRFSVFSIKDLLDKKANQLSGGERHQLALTMCLLKNTKLLVLDEPSAGLSPSNVNKLYETLEQVRQQKEMTIILIEQNIAKAIEFCSSVNVISNGRVAFHTDRKDIKEIEKIMFNL